MRYPKNSSDIYSLAHGIKNEDFQAIHSVIGISSTLSTIKASHEVEEKIELPAIPINSFNLEPPAEERIIKVEKNRLKLFQKPIIHLVDLSFVITSLLIALAFLGWVSDLNQNTPFAIQHIISNLQFWIFKFKIWQIIGVVYSIYFVYLGFFTILTGQSLGKFLVTDTKIKNDTSHELRSIRT